MTDPRPEPRWGQYAPTPPGSPSAAVLPEPVGPAVDLPPPVAATVVASSRARSSLFDVAATVALLGLGVIDVVSGIGQYADLAPALREVYTQQGFGEFTSDALALTVGLIINIARSVILAVTIVVSLVFISRRRRAFWIPLVGAALAFLTVVVCLVVLMASDPALASYLEGLRG